MAATLQTMALTALLLIVLTLFSLQPHVNAREIVGTNEWQLIGENDTVPAGLHIKMDLSTGERWARLVQDEDDDPDLQGVAAEVDKHTGALTVSSDPTDSTEDVAEDTQSEEFKPQRDYEMMHRVMSRLPPEELERFGGLPALPVPKETNDKQAVLSISPEDRADFEAKMEELWTLRQEELRKFQEDNLADIPKMLKERINVLRDYVRDPLAGRAMIIGKRKQQELQEHEDVDEQEEDAAADDVIECLKDLEYQLSDIDHARDFHTLGGWPYLVALLHHNTHLTCNPDTITDLSLVYEIQALAAMAIGTAVGNLGEFSLWALEDVSDAMNVMLNEPKRASYRSEGCSKDNFSSFDGSISALFSLADSFETKSIPTQIEEQLAGASVKDSFRTYKLRAVYALGSLLRGNVLAQKHFVSRNGPDALVRYAMGILSSVNGKEGISKLDYKLASKVLALGEDVVMGVLLQEEDYTTADAITKISVSPNRMVAAFTTEPWCDLSLRMLAPPIKVVGESQARGMKEHALTAIRALGPACKANSQSQCSAPDNSEECAESGSSWGVTQVRKVRSEWNREGSGDGLDSVYRRELLDLIDGVLEALK
jgi:nucleotide exchange factor SIL1